MRLVDVDTVDGPIRSSPSPTISTASIGGLRRARSYIWARITAQPATVFVFLSLAFGSLIIFILPPLRAPDEVAHFLRIYSYARGELLPVAEVDSQKGTYVERKLYDQLLFFRSAGEWFAVSGGKDVRYGRIMALYRNSVGIIEESDQAASFAPFAGTEGYHPTAYIPYIAAAAVGRLLRLDFPDLLLLMRLFGLAAFTAAAAYAVAVTPVLKWAFVLIAMLPVSLYNRSVLSADGAALCSAMVITALCLRGASKVTAGRVWERSLWMTLCALSKQPQIVFVLLEFMVSHPKKLWRRWSSIAIVVLPSLILSPLWVVAVSADIAAWRLQMEGYHPPEHFDPLWKLVYMWENPYHFPLATWTALTGWGDRLWVELIGILGWQDIVLRPWIYVVLTICLMLVPLQRLQLKGPSRARVALMTGLCVLGYVAVVYLIFFLTYTPLDSDHVRGVQGRYFVITLPVAAIFVAAVINRQLSEGMPTVIATAGSMIAGIATVEALLQAHW
jgi:uncharacterized membrane protein